jgi:uncharacterized RDD family membrane protein YckC
MKYAGFWIRFCAHAIDFLAWNAAELAIEYGISTPLKLGAVEQQVLGVVASFILVYLYYVELPQRLGTTPGKWLFGIYVLDGRTGEVFSRKQAMGRMMSYLLSYAIIGCGFLMAAFHPEKRALHDLLTGTCCLIKRDKDLILASDPKVPEKTDGAH